MGGKKCEIVINRLGNVSVLYDQFVYYKHSGSGHKVLWRCGARKCYSTVTTIDYTVVSVNNRHCHPPPKFVREKLLRNKLKQEMNRNSIKDFTDDTVENLTEINTEPKLDSSQPLEINEIQLKSMSKSKKDYLLKIIDEAMLLNPDDNELEDSDESKENDTMIVEEGSCSTGVNGTSHENALVTFEHESDISNSHTKVVPSSSNPRSWTIQQVSDYVFNMTENKDCADAFKEHEIDGIAFLLLNHDHLIHSMQLKVGPSLKIFSSIEDMRKSLSITPENYIYF